MAEKNALRGFDWDSVTGGGLFLKFEADKPVVLRVLTKDPVVNTKTFEGSDGEINVTTKFNFIVYNFTAEKAQILSATPNMAKKISEFDADEDFGADIKKVDLKISPTGNGLQRRYDLQILPKAKTLTNDMIKEAAAIKLDEVIDDGQRMSVYDAAAAKKKADEQNSEVSADDFPSADSEPVSEEDLDNIPF